jgi:hypothetical protein
LFGGAGGGGDFGGGGGDIGTLVAQDGLNSTPAAELFEVSLESKLNFVIDALNVVFVSEGVVPVALEVDLYIEDGFM